MSDPRKNLPSASGMSRLKACPGSFALEQTVPREEERNDPDAEHGNAIHACLAGQLFPTLTPQQKETVEMCESIVQKVLEKLEFKVHAIFNHKRFWLMGINLEPVFSGEVDRVVVNERRSDLVIFDFKTLFGEHEEATDNLQLMSLAVVAAEHFIASKVTVCLIQPWKAGQFTLAVYDDDAIEKASAELGRILDAAAHPNAPRVAGPQCKLCRAQFKCPEAQGQMMALKVMTDTALTEGHQLAAFWDVWQVIKSRGDNLEQLIKQRLTDDPQSIPGLVLKPGNEVRKIKDAGAAYLSVKDVMTAQQFAACCKVGIGDLTEGYVSAFQTQTPGVKRTKKKIEEDLETRLGSVIEKKRNSPSIVKVKPTPEIEEIIP